jgi:hypothetical protein
MAYLPEAVPFKWFSWQTRQWDCLMLVGIVYRMQETRRWMKSIHTDWSPDCRGHDKNDSYISVHLGIIIGVQATHTFKFSTAIDSTLKEWETNNKESVLTLTFQRILGINDEWLYDDGFISRNDGRIAIQECCLHQEMTHTLQIENGIFNQSKREAMWERHSPSIEARRPCTRKTRFYYQFIACSTILDKCLEHWCISRCMHKVN